ncbi:hypothetical protein ACFL1X_02845 [Candidatus Hydrogenedentota bacterium]
MSSVSLLPFPGGGRSLYWASPSPSGRKIAFVYEDFDSPEYSLDRSLGIANLTTGKTVTVENELGFEYPPIWLDEDRILYFSSSTPANPSSRLLMYKVGEEKVSFVTKVQGVLANWRNSQTLFLSHSGEYVAFLKTDTLLAIAALSETKLRNVTSRYAERSYDSRPMYWSSDDRSIFTTDGEHLVEMDVPTLDAHEIATFDFVPVALKANERRTMFLALDMQGDQRYQWWIASADGSVLKPIGLGKGIGQSPVLKGEESLVYYPKDEWIMVLNTEDENDRQVMKLPGEVGFIFTEGPSVEELLVIVKGMGFVSCDLEAKTYELVVPFAWTDG